MTTELGDHEDCAIEALPDMEGNFLAGPSMSVTKPGGAGSGGGGVKPGGGSGGGGGAPGPGGGQGPGGGPAPTKLAGSGDSGKKRTSVKAPGGKDAARAKDGG